METYSVASTNGSWVAVPHANQASALVVDVVADCPSCNSRTTPHVRPTKATLTLSLSTSPRLSPSLSPSLSLALTLTLTLSLP